MLVSKISKYHRFKYLWVLICLISVLGLSNCTSSTSFLAPKEPVTITFIHGRDEGDYYEALVQQFNELYPNITVEITNFWRASEETTIDVLVNSQFGLLYMLEENLPMNLNALMAEDKDFDIDDFYPSTVEALSTEGQYWGLPIGVDMMLMYYNKDLFDRYNTPYPQMGWTWNDFVERASKISYPEAGIFGYALRHLGGDAVNEAMTFMYQHGGQIFDDIDHPTRMTFNEPLNIEALQWYADLLHKHEVAPQMGQLTIPYPEEGIRQGNYAMWMGWYSQNPGVSQPEDWAVRWGAMPLPKDQNAATMAGVVGGFINAETQHPEACWLWLKFLSEQTTAELLPARRSLAESDTYTQKVGNDLASAGRAAVNELLVIKMDMSGQMYRNWGTAWQAFEDALAKIRKGEDPRTVLNEAQDKSGF